MYDHKAYQRQWYLDNRERLLAKANSNYTPHPRVIRGRDPERARLRTVRYRMRKLNQYVEDIDRDIVYSMHGGMCGICKEFVLRDDFHVDHIVPVSRGGMHGYFNVQPSHPLCNRKKAASC